MEQLAELSHKEFVQIAHDYTQTATIATCAM